MQFFEDGKPILWFFAFQKVIPQLDDKVIMKLHAFLEKFFDMMKFKMIDTSVNYSGMSGLNKQNQNRVDFSDRILSTLFPNSDIGRTEISIEIDNIERLIREQVSSKSIWIGFKKRMFLMINQKSDETFLAMADRIEKMMVDSELNLQTKFIKSDFTMDIPKIKQMLFVLGLIPPSTILNNQIFVKFFSYKTVKTI